MVPSWQQRSVQISTINALAVGCGIKCLHSLSERTGVTAMMSSVLSWYSGVSRDRFVFASRATECVSHLHGHSTVQASVPFGFGLENGVWTCGPLPWMFSV